MLWGNVTDRVVTVGKLFTVTHLFPYRRAVYFGQFAVTLCVREGNLGLDILYRLLTTSSRPTN